MARFRTLAGFFSLVLIALSLNVLVLKEDLFATVVFLPFAAGIGLGVLWVVLRLVTLSQEARGNTLSGVNTFVGSVVFLAICVTIYAFVLRWDTTWDLTKEGRRELAPQTKQVLENLSEDVKVYGLFVTTGDALVDVAQGKVERFLEQCQSYTNHLDVTFIDPQRNPERVKQLNIKRMSNVGTVVLQSGTRQREIPLSDVTKTLEERDFTNALINVVRESRPTVYFLTGHNERRIDDQNQKTGASDFKLWLEKEAYEVKQHLIKATDPGIPQDCSLLIINNYEEDFRPYEIEALDRYMRDGGRLLFLTDPSVVASDPEGRDQIEQLRPWLETRFGVQVGSDFVVSVIGAQSQEPADVMLIHDFNLLGQWGQGESAKPSKQFRGSFNAKHSITRDLDQQMVWKMVRSVRLRENMPKGVSGTVLLRTTPDTWAETSVASVFNAEGANISRDDHEPLGPQPVAVAASASTDVPIGDGSRTKDARVVVAGNSTFTTNERIDYVSNQNFLLNAIAWLTESEELIAIRPTGDEDQPVILSQTQQQFIAWLASLGTVQVVAVAGVVMYWARRRYR